MGTTEVKSKVKVLENTVLLPSPRLQRCSYRDVRYKATLRAVGRKGPFLPLEDADLKITSQPLQRQTDKPVLWE